MPYLVYTHARVDMTSENAFQQLRGQKKIFPYRYFPERLLKSLQSSQSGFQFRQVLLFQQRDKVIFSVRDHFQTDIPEERGNLPEVMAGLVQKCGECFGTVMLCRGILRGHGFGESDTRDHQVKSGLGLPCSDLGQLLPERTCEFLKHRYIGLRFQRRFYVPRDFKRGRQQLELIFPY